MIRIVLDIVRDARDMRYYCAFIENTIILKIVDGYTLIQLGKCRISQIT